jgi:hypothetical protein
MPPEGVRRSTRVPKEIAILLVGSDMEGKMFSEQTKTVLLSRHGAGIVSQYALYAEQELILRRLDTNKEAEVRVVGQLGVRDKLHTYGVAFLNPEMDLWGIKFPGMTESEKAASRVMLQCCGCKSRELVEQIDLESDVYRVNEGIVRSCKKCGASTYWRQAIEDGDGETSISEPSTLAYAETAEPVEALTAMTMTEPAPSAPAAVKTENRRKHVRTRANFKACIRTYSFGEEIVTCEDISRGGLSFKSKKEYATNSDVEVAAPYSAGAQSIFVRAQIVYVVELKQERRFRCGVRYAKT